MKILKKQKLVACFFISLAVILLSYGCKQVESLPSVETGESGGNEEIEEPPVPEKSNFCIIFDANGGTFPDGMEVIQFYDDSNDQLPSDPVRPGHNLINWDYVLIENPQDYNSYYLVKYTAKWEEKYPGMKYVGGGDFSFDIEHASSSSENVTLSSFYMAEHEVTQKEFEEVMGYNPSYFNTLPYYGEIQELRPVENITWFEALVYCNRRSIKEGLTPCYKIKGSYNPDDWGNVPKGEDYEEYKYDFNEYDETLIEIFENDSKPPEIENLIAWTKAECNFQADGYRLPTAVEFFYAYTGGINKDKYKYSGSNSINEVAWYKIYDSFQLSTHQVGLKKSNSLGIYDMTGNVCEYLWELPFDYFDFQIADNNMVNPLMKSRVIDTAADFVNLLFFACGGSIDNEYLHVDGRGSLFFDDRIEFSLLVREPVNNSYSRYWGMRVVRTYKDD